MRATTIQIKNYRSFVETQAIDLDSINLLVGANNAGKSSILRAIYLLQSGAHDIYPDIRTNETTAIVNLTMEGVPPDKGWGMEDARAVTITLHSPDKRSGSLNIHCTTPEGNQRGESPISSVSPHHWIVPYFSKRKTAAYSEDIRAQFALQMTSSMANLSGKLSRIANPEFPGYGQYRDACKEILGFVVTAVTSENGQRAGVYLPDRETIFIDQMGEGVPNIVALLVDLAVSENKIFLMEEPENDLHPKALKALLDLILKSSHSNQFVISTHSNIVLRHLGAHARCNVFEVRTKTQTFPVEAEVRPVEKTPQARLELLRDLGYSFSDFDLWDGWLILEEASAERIIRDYLVPWFAPRLSRVRTLAANGVSNVAPTFEDLNRLVRFTHLEAAYQDKAWIRVDGDESGQQLVRRLRERYPTWSEDRFGLFNQSSFERFYPAVFQDEVTAVLAVPDRQQRRLAKKALLDKVIGWLDEDEHRGRQELETSAREVIADLLVIERQI